MNRMPDNPLSFWSDRGPEQYADYYYDATTLVTSGNPADFIQACTLSVKPSLEVIPTRLILASATVAGVWLQGGVPGRQYLFKLLITTVRGRVFEVLIGQLCTPLLADDPVPLPENPGFSAPITSAPPSLNFSIASNVGMLRMLGRPDGNITP